ncbi:MAG TPA: three-Cys-motif partner protein TcmP [Pyrinomonadaceae bacterium]|jgi:three-Cys-motif partner protein|nr:three-Cys-motif partner protein TcmP [Pyrinomonadaceae bacterium]
MPYKDLHDEPFDESTITKLEIFEDYAQAWLPVWIMSNTPHIAIFDFFAGAGYDKNGIAGSPIRILEKINEQLDNIFQKNIKVSVYLNEYESHKKDQSKFEKLKTACLNYLSEHADLQQAIELHLFNKKFEDLFIELLPKIKQHPSLVYLDQNGIKFLSAKYFLELENIPRTDFLYFVSASYFWRFGESKEFQNHLDIDMSLAKSEPYKFIHRSIIEQLRKKLPSHSKLKLYPFSLKKDSNIYGIIFGASHPSAVEKFLTIAWKRNETNGEANFDIDDDAGKLQLGLFGENRLTKLEEFERNVKEKILADDISNNYELLDYSFSEGHLGAHAANVLKKMKKEGEVLYDGISPLVTYRNVHKDHRKLEYKIKKP